MTTDTSPASGVVMYGADWCRDCVRAKSWLEDNGIDFTYVDLVAEPEQADAAQAISGRTNIPVITLPDGGHLVEPSNAELAAALGR